MIEITAPMSKIESTSRHMDRYV